MTASSSRVRVLFRHRFPDSDTVEEKGEGKGSGFPEDIADPFRDGDAEAGLILLPEVGPDSAGRWICPSPHGSHSGRAGTLWPWIVSAGTC